MSDNKEPADQPHNSGDNKPDVHEKGDRPNNPRNAVKRVRSGAGILPVALYNDELHILLQHEISEDKPKSEKNFGFTDFGGAMKPEDNENIHLVAAREFTEEVYNGRDLLLPNDLSSSTEKLADHLKTCRLVFVKGYAMFILPVNYVPACILAEGLAKDDYRSGKKIQTIWWFPLSEVKRVFLPLHARVLPRNFHPALASVERRLKGTVSDKPRRFRNKSGRKSESGGGVDGEETAEKDAAEAEAVLEERKKAEEEEAKLWAANVRAQAETYKLQNQESKALWAARLAKDPARYKLIQRRCMWETMDMLKQVMKPLPCVDRIPNFFCCDLAGRKLAEAKEFTNKEVLVVKVNPSLAQTYLRFLTLCKRKTLLTPSPALEGDHFMYRVDPNSVRGRRDRNTAATKSGVVKLGEGLTSTSDWSDLHIDILVVGSVVVCPKTGARLGKGTGWAELEVAILTELGVVDEKTLFATTVHDAQIVFAFPGSELSLSHDICVDLIATPTRLIRVPKSEEPREPAKIQWDMISEDKLKACPILREMKDRKANGLRPTE